MDSVLGIDPSLKGTGLCLLSPEEGLAIFDKIKYDEKMEPTFKGLFDRVMDVKLNFDRFFQYYKPDVVVSESPIPVGQWSAGLNALDSVLFLSILESLPLMYTLNPTYLGVLLQKKKYNHSEYVRLAVSIIEEEGFTSSVKRFSADEAAAFLFAFRIAIKIGYKPKVVRTQFTLEKEHVLGGGSEWHVGRVNRLQRSDPTSLG